MSGERFDEMLEVTQKALQFKKAVCVCGGEDSWLEFWCFGLTPVWIKWSVSLINYHHSYSLIWLLTHESTILATWINKYRCALQCFVVASVSELFWRYGRHHKLPRAMVGVFLQLPLQSRRSAQLLWGKKFPWMNGLLRPGLFFPFHSSELQCQWRGRGGVFITVAGFLPKVPCSRVCSFTHLLK